MRRKGSQSRLELISPFVSPSRRRFLFFLFVFRGGVFALEQGVFLVFFSRLGSNSRGCAAGGGRFLIWKWKGRRWLVNLSCLRNRLGKGHLIPDMGCGWGTWGNMLPRGGGRWRWHWRWVWDGMLQYREVPASSIIHARPSNNGPKEPEPSRERKK